MGSVISFPLLCILSLTAYLYEAPGIDEALLSSDEDFEIFLKKQKRVGVNGDDVVFAATPARVEGWVRGVKAIGGVVSRGKSLLNNKFFTVNSELWSLNGKINCLRPSLVTALTGDNRYFITPQYEWKEFRAIATDEHHRIFNLIQKLKLHIPPSLGGIGLEYRFDANDMFTAYVNRQVEKRCTPYVKYGTLEFQKEFSEKKANLEYAGKKWPMWVDRNWHKVWQQRFGTKKFNFALKPHEIRFCLIHLQRPDIFGDQFLKHLREDFEVIKFESKKDVISQCERDKERILTRLTDEYDLLMQRKKLVELPVELANVYYAQVTDEVNQMIIAENEFNADHPPDV